MSTWEAYSLTLTCCQGKNEAFLDFFHFCSLGVNEFHKRELRRAAEVRHDPVRPGRYFHVASPGCDPVFNAGTQLLGRQQGSVDRGAADHARDLRPPRASSPSGRGGAEGRRRPAAGGRAQEEHLVLT